MPKVFGIANELNHPSTESRIKTSYGTRLHNVLLVIEPDSQFLD